MSIAQQNNEQIARLRSAISDAYAACNEKDATMPPAEIISGLADCIRSIQHGIPDGYIQPSGNSPAITSNGTHNVRQYENAVVSVPVPSDYVKFNRYYTEQYNPPGSALVLSKTFTCGFRPKVILIVPNTDTTFSTTNSEIFSAYISIGSHALRREGIYKLSTSNRVGASSGGIGSLTDTGFTYSHASIGFKPGVAYDVYVWGES